MVFRLIPESALIDGGGKVRVGPRFIPRPTPPRCCSSLAFVTNSGEKRRAERCYKRKFVGGRVPDVSDDNELAQLIRKRGPQMVHRGTVAATANTARLGDWY